MNFAEPYGIIPGSNVSRAMKNSTSKKILLAEDDDSMRRLLEIILEKAGYEVLSAEDGLQALELSLENDFHALVADAVMPNLSGYDLCRMVSEQNGEVPMIILSGLNQENNAEAEGCPADAFLTKTPKLKEELVSTLKELL